MNCPKKTSVQTEVFFQLINSAVSTFPHLDIDNYLLYLDKSLINFYVQLKGINRSVFDI